jgi:hypothetical protein
MVSDTTSHVRITTPLLLVLLLALVALPATARPAETVKSHSNGYGAGTVLTTCPSGK